MDDRPRYMISVAAELVGMHPQTLRIYEQKGLVRPKRTAGNTRLYSDADVERLRLIQRLTTEIGLNLAGVERVLHLEDELARMRRRLDRMEREMREAIDAGAPRSTAATSSSTGPAQPPARRRSGATMDFNKLTIKSQEAVAAAQELARRRGNPEIYPEHLLLALLDQELFADWQGLRAEAEQKLAGAPDRERRRRTSSRRSRTRSGRCSTAPTASARSSRTTTSRPSTSSSRSSRCRATRSSPGSRRCAAASASPRRIPRAATRRSRSSAAT